MKKPMPFAKKDAAKKPEKVKVEIAAMRGGVPAKAKGGKKK